MRVLSKFTPSVLLYSVLALAALVRFWNLGSVPPSPSMDEASIGYNAYSVLKTGVDEFGRFPLIYQRGYDDWRRSTYLLLTIPPIALFGLRAEAIRLPSVVLSVLTVYALYHIVLLLFSKKTQFVYGAAFSSALILAISPWHIYISRLGHESNACLSFFVFAVLFFLKGLQNKVWLYASTVFFILAMISYYSGQIIVPIFGAALVVLYRTELWNVIKKDRKMQLFILLTGAVLIPILWSLFSPESMTRFQGTSTFKPESHQELFASRVEKWNKAVQDKNPVDYIRYHRRLFPFQVFISGYLAHFNPEWLFDNKSSDSFKAPLIGLLYKWELPLVLIGCIVLFLTKKIDNRSKFIVFSWFLFAYIPPSVATQTPHAMRSYNGLPLWSLFTGFGISYLFSLGKKIRIPVAIVIAVLVINSFYQFLIHYFIEFPKQQSRSFHYALSQAMPYVLENEHKYDFIVFSNEEKLYQSYMLYLFYSEFDPEKYQRLGGTKSAGYAQTHYFSKYEFRKIDWASDEQKKNVLFIGNESDFPDQFTGKIFTDMDGAGKVKVVERN